MKDVTTAELSKLVAAGLESENPFSLMVGHLAGMVSVMPSDTLRELRAVCTGELVERGEDA